MTSLRTGRSVIWDKFPCSGKLFSIHKAQPDSGAHTAVCSILRTLGSVPSIKTAEAWTWTLSSMWYWDFVCACYYPFTSAYVFMILCLFRQMDSISFVKWTAGWRSVFVKSKEAVFMTCRIILLFYKMIFVLLCNVLLVVLKFRNDFCKWGVTLHSCIWKEYQVRFLFAKLYVHRDLGRKKNQPWKIIV